MAAISDRASNDDIDVVTQVCLPALCLGATGLVQLSFSFLFFSSPSCLPPFAREQSLSSSQTHKMPAAVSLAVHKTATSFIGLVGEQIQGLDSPSNPPCWCRSKCTNGTKADIQTCRRVNDELSEQDHRPARLHSAATRVDEAPLRRRRRRCRFHHAIIQNTGSVPSDPLPAHAGSGSIAAAVRLLQGAIKSP